MDETQLLLSRLDDLINQYYYGKTSYMGFLNETETSLACSYLKNRGVEFRVFGGYPTALRNFLCVGSCDDGDFPFECLRISSKGKKEISHRDFLGSLMGLGIKRECIGDILLLNQKEAVAFVRVEITPHIIRDLKFVGREPVNVNYYDGDVSTFSANVEETRIIVSSMRLDNIVSSCIGSSRSLSSELISSGKVFVNMIEEKKPSKIITEDDIISIRGYGKFIVGTINGKTKRDRLIVSLLHYI